MINFSGLKLVLTQGKGFRKLSIVLGTDYQGSTYTNVELKIKGMPESVVESQLIVRATVNHPDLISAIDLNKRHDWYITGIAARVHPLSFKVLGSFKGVFE